MEKKIVITQYEKRICDYFAASIAYTLELFRSAKEPYIKIHEAQHQYLPRKKRRENLEIYKKQLNFMDNIINKLASVVEEMDDGMYDALMEGMSEGLSKAYDNYDCRILE